MKTEKGYTKPLHEIRLHDLPEVGGKNASLGEMISALVPQGIRVPDGFVVLAQAYWDFLNENGLKEPLQVQLQKLDTKTYHNLQEIGKLCREMILQGHFSTALEEDIVKAFRHLQKQYPQAIQVAVRSSATAEDLPHASFAGQQESYLNIENERELLGACKACYASLFTDRAIKYREDHGYQHMEVALSIGVQKMVRSDKACAGVCFTLDPETGFGQVIHISAAWGLGENVVKGQVSPDEYVLFKPTLLQGKQPILSKRKGAKEKTMYYRSKKGKTNAFDAKTINKTTPKAKQNAYCLAANELDQLAKWAIAIENHYQRAMDIEWAKDGLDGQLYIVQARPETVHSTRKSYEFYDYKLLERGPVLARGVRVGQKITSGKARILKSPKEINHLKKGEVLVTEITNPDWDPILKKAAAIVTNRGGRTSHAAIVARETGAVAVVGAGNATERIKEGQEVTVSCAEGNEGIVYAGKLKWKETALDTRKIKLPDTQVMFTLADPDQAFKLSFLPNNGVGLMRLEFVINYSIRIHPMALAHFSALKEGKVKQQIEKITADYPDKKEYFIDKLSSAVATLAAAFYPKEVIVRMSDFKSNEYAHLIGGEAFEPHEENPMLGWRGASRYYDEGYRDGFALECAAMKRVREDMGLENVKLMIPFCRTPEEARKVLHMMENYGLKRGEAGLEVYMMVEIPSNVLLAKEFAQWFDGFSIGSNDLTQLTLGIGRDSERLAALFNAEDPAVKKLIAEVIHVAHLESVPIGLCGQAPSDSPDFAAFLVKTGIDSISFNPDALIKGIDIIHRVEQDLEKEQLAEDEIEQL